MGQVETGGRQKSGGFQASGTQNWGSSGSQDLPVTTGGSAQGVTVGVGWVGLCQGLYWVLGLS